MRASSSGSGSPGRGGTGLARVGRVLQREDNVLAACHLTRDVQGAPYDADLLQVRVLGMVFHRDLDWPVVANHAVWVHDSDLLRSG